MPRPAMPADLLSIATYQSLVTPTIRLGVTGLARAGKTVFTIALVQALTRGGRLPFFPAMASGRIVAAYLEPQPDDAVPRFDYEEHLATLVADPPAWPDSTKRISQLRLTIEYESRSLVWRQLGRQRLHVDIVDYPGEWLVDLAMMDQSYAEWSARALALARVPSRAVAARLFLERLTSLDPHRSEDEPAAIEAARLFTAYLHAARAAEPGLSTLGPGRFLMPGDLQDSPLLSFAPLDLAAGTAPAGRTLGALMERRYESYKKKVVVPFFRDHFSRLDRQIVLVDALTALNSGARAVDELTEALEASLKAFRPGRSSWLAAILGRRVDRILFAATKADHLHHTSHDRLEAALRRITDKAAERAAHKGAEVQVLALAALRATEEAEAKVGGDRLPCIKGVPMAGEKVGGQRFDGRKAAAVFPGDLPADPKAGLEAIEGSIEIVKFRPPVMASGGTGQPAVPWPHIRLDRALDFLLGDRLQ